MTHEQFPPADSAHQDDLSRPRQEPSREYESQEHSAYMPPVPHTEPAQQGGESADPQEARYSYQSPSFGTEHIRPDEPGDAVTPNMREYWQHDPDPSAYGQEYTQPYGQQYDQNETNPYGYQQPDSPAYMGQQQGSNPFTYEAPATYPNGDAGGFAAPSMMGNGAAVASSPTPKKKNRSRKRGPGWFAVIIAMLAAVALSLGGAWGIGRFLAPGGTQASSASSAKSSQSSSQSAPVISSNATWAEVAAAVSPATVSINVQGGQKADIGSGVIYDAQGNIVTNYHVVAAAEKAPNGQISVTLSDGRIYEAKIVGVDPTTDLAVIRIVNPPSDLSVATFGSSADVKVGQDIMAIGSPLGLSSTVTTGIVSALNRPVEVATKQPDEQEEQPFDPRDPFGQLPQNQNRAPATSVITNAIQVDASINPGNSGGPLFDAQGKVIGINSSIASMSSGSSSAGSIGLGFAIPSDLVKSVADQIISNGVVDHAALGVMITTGTAAADGATRMGAEISQVNDGSAAAEAGLKAGDVITAVDGNSVQSGKALSGYIRRYTGGDRVTIEYVRDGKLASTDVTLQSQQQH